MGSSSSKQEIQDPTKGENVFQNINTPIIVSFLFLIKLTKFTNPLISHLDSTKESNSTRSASIEAHIQSRVQQELARLEARSDSLQEKVEEALKRQGLLTERESANLNSVTLEGDIKELREKFKGIKDSKEDVEARKAREDLVQCLQLHDRRSLDCWWEVQQFKDKVARLEKEFVNKNQ